MNNDKLVDELFAAHPREDRSPSFADKDKGETKAWDWRKYNGSNPHTKHFHLSVQPDPGLYDDKEDWIVDPVVPA